jgi:hypothetical protein
MLAEGYPLPPGTSITDPPECRGDRAETVADLFRFLQRAREYLIEAARQLQVEDLTPEESAKRATWYAAMDAADEWTGDCAEAHLDCVEGIIFFFEQTIPDLTGTLDNKPFMVRGPAGDLEWQKLRITATVAELRKDAAALYARLAPGWTSH